MKFVFSRLGLIFCKLVPFSNLRRKWRNKLIESIKYASCTPNFITPEQAHKLGYSELFMTWRGIGDQIMLSAAAEQYYKLTGKKALLIADMPDFFLNLDHCFVLRDFKVQDEIYRNLPCSDSVKIGRYEFKVRFVSCSDIDKSGRIKWASVHVIARIIERMGVGGQIEIAPKIILSDKEKSFGRFFADNQICVMNGGCVEYKNLPSSTMQSVIDALKGKYNFIQIGARNDEPLKNVCNLQGKLTLRKVACVLYNSELFVGTIGGLMHMARAVECTGVIAYSAEPLIYDNYDCNEQVLSYDYCDICPKGEIYPLFDECPHGYKCIKTITSEQLIEAIERKLSLSKIFPKQIVDVRADISQGLDDLRRSAIYWKNPKRVRGKQQSYF